MHIYLIGFMAVGKTTIGKQLAKALELPFTDTDKLIEEQTGKNISRWFDEDGEEAFRIQEAQTLRQLSDEPHIIATGGGLPCYHQNMEYMNQRGITIYLKADPAFIEQRLRHAKAPRPLIKTINFDELNTFITAKLAQREPFYNQSKVTVRVPFKSLQPLVNSVLLAISHKPPKL